MSRVDKSRHQIKGEMNAGLSNRDIAKIIQCLDPTKRLDFRSQRPKLAIKLNATIYKYL